MCPKKYFPGALELFKINLQNLYLIINLLSKLSGASKRC